MYQGNIVFVYDGSLSGQWSAMWLATWPTAVLSRNGYFVESMSLFDVVQPSRTQTKVLEQADIIFYERHIDDPWLSFLDWATNNKRLYLMLDDAYWLAHPSEPTHHFWFKNNRLEKLEIVAKQARGVVAPSRKLAAHFDNGIFKPNRPDFLDPCWSPSLLLEDKAILWGGTSGHIAGMENHPCLEAIKRLVTEDEARFVLISGSNIQLTSIIGKKVGNVTYSEYLPYPEWLKVLSGASISICPIGAGYDEHRSWIKALESSAVGTVWVGSDCGVYEDAEGGVEVGNTVEAWYEGLKWLLNDDEAREKLRNDGIQWAWKQGLNDHLDEWEAIFNDF